MGDDSMTPKHIVSAAVIVSNAAGEILLVKSPRRGWEMPGGQVEEGESVFAAATREVQEETGAEIVIDKFCGIFQNMELSIVNLLFRGSQVGGTLTTSDESLEVGYFPLSSVLEMVTWPTFRDRITMSLSANPQPFCIVYPTPPAPSN